MIGAGATLAVAILVVLGTTSDFENWMRLSAVDFVWAAAAVGAAWVSFAAAASLKGRDAVAWAFVGIASLAWLAGMLVGQYAGLTSRMDLDDTSIAGVGIRAVAPLSDAGLLAMAPLLTVALYFCRPAREGWNESIRRLLTLGIISVALTITVAVVFDDLAGAVNDFGLIIVLAVAYAVLYLTAFIFGLDSLRGGAGTDRQRMLALMVAGIGSHAIAQALYGFSVVSGPFQDRFDRGALWILGFGFLAWAAVEARRSAGRTVSKQESDEPSRQGETLIIGGALLAILVTGVLYRDTVAPEILTILSFPVAALIALLTAREYSNLRVEKRHRERAEHQAAVLQDAFENMVEGMAMFGPDGVMLAANSRLTEVFGLPSDYTERGVTLEEFVRYNAQRGEFGPEDPNGDVRLAAIQKFPFAIDHLRPNGTTVEIRGNSVPGGGRVHTYTDVTRRKKAESELVVALEKAQAANRAKSEFLATVSHELRTPLNAVIGFAELLDGEFGGPLSETQRQYARDILGSGRGLLDMINGILEYSRIESGKTDLRDEDIDLAELVKTQLAAIRGRAEQKGVEIRVEIPDPFPRLRGDAPMVCRILVNLLSNAIKFTPVGGTAIIAAEFDRSAGIAFSVTDTGIGMSAEEIGTAFEKFGQVDSSLSRRYEGVGLGLPLAQSMARHHGADIDLRSESGTGTVATVRFPLDRTVFPNTALAAVADSPPAHLGPVA